MAITKSISFFAPYIVNELNAHVDNIAGGDALLYGGEITVQTSTTVDIAPYIFIQDGVTVFQDEVTAAVTVPDFSTFLGPVHILVSSPDSKNTSGVLISVAEGNEDIDENAIVLASRTQNVWSNPHKPSLIELRKDALASRADSSGGRLSDATTEFDDGYKGWGTNQGFHLNQGEVADSAGAKTVLVVDTSLAEPDSSMEFDLTTVDPDFPRNDYIVARRVSDNLNVPPEIVYAKGETLSVSNEYFEQAATTGSRVVNTSAGNTKPSVAYNATGEHVFIYGNSTNLYHARLDHTATRAIGVGPTATAAGGTVSDVFLAERKDIASGDRLYGCCIVGTEVAIFRTTADGASIGVSDIHIFTSMTFTPSKPHMVVTGEGTTDNPLYAHIVFQHPEAPPNNSQIYYTKYALADATWGTAGAVAVTPKFARGFNGGLNHTAPYVQAHPDGNLHIAYVHAGGALTTGEIRYLVINQAGEVVTPEQALATGTNEVNDGTGTGITLGSAGSEQPKVVISPQGSVYVVWVDLSEAVLANEAVVAWEPTMLERTGFHAVVLYSASTLNNFQWHSAFSDDLGNLCWLGTTIVLGDSDEVTAHWFKFAPVLVGDGINIAPDNLNLEFDTGFTNSVWYSLDSSDGSAILDRDGSLSISDLSTNTVLHHKLSTMARVDLFDDKKKPHPKDEYLARISIPIGASNTVSSLSDTMVHTTKVKSVPPITVVGKDGQYGTFTGLQEALWSLRGVGGKVLIKGGEYLFKYALKVPSGVEVIGDGHVVLVHEGFGKGIVCDSLRYQTVATEADATRRIYTIAGGGVDNLLQNARVGDVGFLWDWGSRPVDNRADWSDPFVITRILDNSTFQANRSLTADLAAFGGVGVDAYATIFSTGVKLQNLTLYDARSSGLNVNLVDIESMYMGVFKDLHIIQTQGTATVMDVQGCYGTRFENLIVDKVAANLCFNMQEKDGEIYNFDTTLSHCAFRGDASIADFVGLKVNSCLAENWTITGTPTEVPVWTNNAGVISATSFDSAALWGDDASVFANRIVLNEDSGFDTNGNIRGNLVPTGSTSSVGNTTKKWDEVVSGTVHAFPSTGSVGLKLDASGLDRLQDTMSEVTDWGGDLIDVQDPLGQWVGTNKFEDDFLYLPKQWVVDGVPQSPYIPDEIYDFTSTSVSGTSPDVSIDSGALIPDAIEFSGAGILVGRVANTDEMRVYGPPGFAAGWLATDKRIVFKIKHSFGYPSGGSVIEANLHRTDRFGIVDINGNHDIYIEYLNTSTPAPYPIINLVIDDKTNPASKTNLPNSAILMDTWRVYYIVVEHDQVRAWVDGASSEVVKTFSPGAPGPNAPGSIVKYRPYWEIKTDGAASENKHGYVDYWCLYNNSLLR